MPGSSSAAVATPEPTTTPSSNVPVPSPSLGEPALAHASSSGSANHPGPLGLAQSSLGHIPSSLPTPALPIPASARDVDFHTPRTPQSLAAPSIVPSNASGSSKRTYADMSELPPDDDELSSGYMAPEPDSEPQAAPSSAPHASTTLVSAPASKKSRRSIRRPPSDLIVHRDGAGRGSRTSNTAAIWAMQGSMNRIGDILEGAVQASTTRASTSASAASSSANPSSPGGPGSAATSEIRALTVLEHAMHIMQTEDADLPADDLGTLMAIFSADANGRVTEVYSRSSHHDARRAYVRTLISTYNRDHLNPPQ